ncbi:MAG TPA: class I SAM-dependent methyltransferase [Tepidisphaeraceae bacterium]|nr:class I SAM-dependent methyltransferase [Tepidisphaeraceae bacterium]
MHTTQVHTRRVGRLCELLSDLLPREGRVLDVGCGDGLLAKCILNRVGSASADRLFNSNSNNQSAEADPPTTTFHVEGIDVLVREGTHVPVTHFDGKTIPFDDNTFDSVLFVDVLHHTEAPMLLLREARRVTRGTIVIKDHTMNGLAAGPTLRFMDRVGNARYGVSLPYNYWPERKWLDAFSELDLTVEAWKNRLGLYPFPANLVFGRTLHFIAKLRK